MQYKAIVAFLHDELGAIAKGQDVQATPTQAATPLMLGYFAPVENKPAASDLPKPAKAKK